jgi:hypothetical protein
MLFEWQPLKMLKWPRRRRTCSTKELQLFCEYITMFMCVSCGVAFVSGSRSGEVRIKVLFTGVCKCLLLATLAERVLRAGVAPRASRYV